MPEANVIPMRKSKNPQVVTLTPDAAMALLEHNTLNRPLSDPHVKRIAGQILDGKWRYNGDTIKVSDDGMVLDGQHRLWAIVEAKKPVETIVVHGIHRDAFATVDTLRKPRHGADILALNGLSQHRAVVSSALQWLLRYQKGAFDTGISRPENRVEVADIEEAYSAHPTMVTAVERAKGLRYLANPALIAFVYFIAYNRDPVLADQMMDTLDNPSGTRATHPFFVLRGWMLNQKAKGHRIDGVTVAAVMVKALNAAKAGKRIERLMWRKQGGELFPDLEI